MTRTSSEADRAPSSTSFSFRFKVGMIWLCEAERGDVLGFSLLQLIQDSVPLSNKF